MEKKTIGGFITALRKANGMTQKDLAERLNVSDKTVSRCLKIATDLSFTSHFITIFKHFACYPQRKIMSNKIALPTISKTAKRETMILTIWLLNLKKIA